MAWEPIFERLKGALMALGPKARKGALERVIEWATWELDLAGEEEELDRELPATKREVVSGSRRRAGGMVVQQEKVRCGKSTCRKCPHGPYWYGYFREGGRQKSVYLGKSLPVHLVKPEQAEDAEQVG